MDNRELAVRMLETVPKVMRVIRTEMRSLAVADLTVQQFRILARLYHGVASNTQLADALGVSLPAATRIVDSLVRKKLVERAFSSEDRRRVDLTLSKKGRTTFEQLRRKASVRLAVRFEALSAAEKSRLIEGIEILRKAML